MCCTLLLMSTLAHAADVYVSSSQPGGQIEVDGISTGMITPSTVTGLAKGEHQVVVTRGCERGAARVTLASAGAASVTVALETGTATLTVLPEPSDALIELDGKPFGAGAGMPVVVTCGEHSVALSKDGYISTVVNLGLELDQELRLPVALSELGRGTIELSVVPARANVQLDGVLVGEGGVVLGDVLAGPHVLSASLEGYRTAEEQLIIGDGETLSYSWELQREPREGRTEAVRTWSAVGLTLAGAASGIYAVTQYGEAEAAHVRYLREAERVDNGEIPEKQAEQFYVENVEPPRTRFYAAVTAGSICLLGAGVVILF